MISINNRKVEISNFPDGTMLLHLESIAKAQINWHYENDQEMITLLYIVKYLRDHSCELIDLYMPYTPNARQDRVKTDSDVFTLKYFAEFINSLGFNKISIVDPHSSVTAALIDRVNIISPKRYINDVYEMITGIEGVHPIMFYPDEGAMKRYSEMISAPYAFGIKKRDWSSGKILGLDVAGNIELIDGYNILIVDDICSKGGTFYHSAKKLKELGANNIYLYVTHCENTILDGELINSDLIKQIFTTDSIFTKSHELIKVIN